MQNLKDTVNAILDERKEEPKGVKKIILSWLETIPAFIMIAINIFAKEKYAKVGLAIAVFHSLYKLYNKDEVLKISKVEYEDEKYYPRTEEVIEYAKKTDLQNLINALLIMVPASLTCLSCVPYCDSFFDPAVGISGNQSCCDGQYNLKKI
jgi:hypothetical protein